MSGAAVAVREETGYYAAAGMWENLENKWNEVMNGGQLAPKLLEQFAIAADNSGAEMRKHVRDVSTNTSRLYEEKYGDTPGADRLRRRLTGEAERSYQVEGDE